MSKSTYVRISTIALAKSMQTRRAKTYHCIECTALPDELVDLLPRLLPLRIAVRLPGEIAGGAKRRNSRAKHRYSRGMNPGDHLLVCLYEAVVHNCLRIRRGRRRSDVVDSLEDHRVPNPGMRQDVPVHPSQCIWPQPVYQDAVAARRLVHNCNGIRARILLQPREKEIGPSVVLVCLAAASVGDAVTYKRQRSIRGWGPGLHGRDKVPMRRALGLRI